MLLFQTTFIWISAAAMDTLLESPMGHHVLHCGVQNSYISFIKQQKHNKRV